MDDPTWTPWVVFIFFSVSSTGCTPDNSLHGWNYGFLNFQAYLPGANEAQQEFYSEEAHQRGSTSATSQQQQGAASQKTVTNGFPEMNLRRQRTFPTVTSQEQLGATEQETIRKIVSFSNPNVGTQWFRPAASSHQQQGVACEGRPALVMNQSQQKSSRVTRRKTSLQ